MVREEMLATVALVTILALVAVAQNTVSVEGGPPQRVVVVQPQPQPPGGPNVTYQVMQGPGPMTFATSGPGPQGPGPMTFAAGGPGPLPLMRLREYAEQLRTSAREAQELSDRLRRQADELDQIIMRQMNRGPGLKNMGRFQPPPSGPGLNEPQEMKRQIERLRAEAGRAKQEGRLEDSQRIWQEADRMEQQLREQGVQSRGGPGRPVPPEVQEILKAAEQSEREGRMDDARRQREKAQALARQLQEQNKPVLQQPGPQLKDELLRRMEEIKAEIGRLWQAVNDLRNRPKEDRPT